jgi:SAM-dependent methyltransferase
VNASERRLVELHAARPGALASALAGSGSYERLAAAIPTGATRILDLGCGDGHLLRLLGPHAIGCDLSPHELRRARDAVRIGVRARAQALPFATGAFDAVVSHFAFALFDEIERVVGELHRVLAAGGTFAAMLGGGPTAVGRDALHELLELARDAVAAAPRFGDRRAKSEAGWRALFRAEDWHAPRFERCELSVREARSYLEASYVDLAGHAEHMRAPCRIVAWLALVQRR